IGATMRHRWVRVLIWTATGIVVTFVLLIAGLQTPPAKRYVLKRAVELLREQGVTFDASQLSYNLLDLSADLKSVVVRSPQAPNLPILFAADDVQVNMSLLRILRGQYHLQDGQVINPRLIVFIDENGVSNIPQLPQSSSN